MKKKHSYKFIAIIVLLMLVNWIASIFHTRVDLTSEKRFTLSAATKSLLKNLKEPVTVDVFLDGNLPAGFKRLANSSREILAEFKELAGNKLSFNFVSSDGLVPGTQTSYADTLSSAGFIPINLTSQLKEGQQQQNVYPFALLNSGDKKIPISLYQGKTPLISFQELSSAEALLEYNIANGISKLTEEKRSTIGYLTGNGEPEDVRTYDLVQNILQPNYDLFTFNPNTQPVIPKAFDVLLIVKPTQEFSEIAKLKIDQYVMNGGKIIWAIDRLNAELDSLQQGQVIAYDRNLNLNDLFFKYGVRINPDLVMDLQCDYLPFDVNGNGQYELLPWNYFPVMQSPSNHPINKNHGFVSGKFVNSIDTVETENIKKTILLTSSANARTIGTPAIISGKENETAPQSEKYRKAYIPTVVLLEGKFSSLYVNRLTTEMRDSLQKYNAILPAENTANNKMIVMSDADIILNETQKEQPIPMGMNPYTYGTQRAFPFANKEFLISCLDYLVDASDLSAAKGKDYQARLLDTKKLEKNKSLWQMLNVILPAIFILLFGLVYFIVRKKRYSFKHG